MAQSAPFTRRCSENLGNIIAHDVATFLHPQT